MDQARYQRILSNVLASLRPEHRDVARSLFPEVYEFHWQVTLIEPDLAWAVLESRLYTKAWQVADAKWLETEEANDAIQRMVKELMR